MITVGDLRHDKEIPDDAVLIVNNGLCRMDDVTDYTTCNLNSEDGSPPYVKLDI